MKYLTIAFLSFFVACSGCVGLSEKLLTPEEQKEQAIQVLCPDGGGGSGVLLDDRRVLTAHHVTACSNFLLVRNGDVGVSAKVVFSDVESDIALLELDEPIGDVPEPLIGPRPMVDDRVCLQPTRPVPSYRSCGWVTARHDIEKAGDVRFDGFVWFGNSGSGLWDERGRLVGIVVQLALSPNGQVTAGRASSLWSRKGDLL